ncbi:hypothetical protein J6590_101693 [Homalodisca vitripennis]|nr:hypothetical protein J6590_101693 [Homalodisca vitripennis]
MKDEEQHIKCINSVCVRQAPSLVTKRVNKRNPVLLPTRDILKFNCSTGVSLKARGIGDMAINQYRRTQQKQAESSKLQTEIYQHII